jgi:hypothetical protein
LTVKGVVISGKLVGGKTYFTEMAASVRGATGNVSESIAQAFEEQAK